jgi:hypothetical protein
MNAAAALLRRMHKLVDPMCSCSHRRTHGSLSDTPAYEYREARVSNVTTTRLIVSHQGQWG